MLIYLRTFTLWAWCFETAQTDGQSKDARQRRSLESKHGYMKLDSSWLSRAGEGIAPGVSGESAVREGEMAGGCSLVNLRKRWGRWSRPLSPTSSKEISALHATHTFTHRPSPPLWPEQTTDQGRAALPQSLRKCVEIQMSSQPPSTKADFWYFSQAKTLRMCKFFSPFKPWP